MYACVQASELVAAKAATEAEVMEATLRAEAARAASEEAVATAAAKALQVTQLQSELDASRGAVASLESEVELSRAAAVEVCERAAAEVSLLRAQLQEAQVAASDAEEAASSLRRQLASATPPPAVSSAIDADADTSASGKQLATDFCAASKASQEESARLSAALQAAQRSIEEAESKAVQERETLRLQEAKQVEMIRAAGLAELAALRSSHDEELQQLSANVTALEEELRVQDRRVKDAEMSRSQVGGCMSSWVAGCVAGC